MKTSRLFQFILLISFLFLQTCKEIEKQMLVSTGTVTNVLTTTADAGGEILDLGEGATKFGHCYSTSPNAVISGTKTEYSNPSLGGFTSALSGLTPDTKYYIKAYLSRGSEVVYGKEISLTTLSDSKPEVTTDEVTGIDKTTALAGGEVTGQGGTPVTERGVCYSMAAAPTIDNNKIQSGSGTGKFSCSLSGLTPDKKYYVRAYAKNMGGISYGNERSFTTLTDVQVSPTVITDTEVRTITSTSAISGGNVLAEGSSHVTARGVCWGTSTTPAVEINNKTNDGEGTGLFTSNLTGLDPGTKYYLRAYATNSAGTSYGNELNFTTVALPPTLSTLVASSLTDVSVRSGGYITGTGGVPILDKGVCWNTVGNPSLTDSFLSGGTGGLGTFEIGISNLLPKTRYYLKAYATNSAGTSYGEEISFTTFSIPFAETTSVNSISLASGVLNGRVNAYAAPTTVTFEYGTTTAYGQTITADQSPVTGSNLTDITAPISGLTASGQIYHYRIKASNNFGTTYGNDNTFSTAVADADNNVYQTVIIGTQVWMKENLKTSKYNDGSIIGRPASISIFLSQTTGMMAYYDFNEASYKNVYGALYNWYAVNSSKLCPLGWKVPSETDFATLENFIGFDGFGGKIKETGTTHWLSPNTGATNSSGFTALPAGILENSFSYLNEGAYFWSSTEYISSQAWFIGANYDSSERGYYYYPKNLGLSVRCVKN